MRKDGRQILSNTDQTKNVCKEFIEGDWYQECGSLEVYIDVRRTFFKLKISAENDFWAPEVVFLRLIWAWQMSYEYLCRKFIIWLSVEFLSRF